MIFPRLVGGNWHVTWLAIHDRLPTCDRLSKFEIQCAQLCTLCKKENETHSHLFFTCEFSKIVWKGATQCSNMNANTSNWQDVMQYIESQCNKNNATHQLSRMTLSVTQYMIWKERNARTFQKIHQSAQGLLRQIKEIVYIRGLKTNQMKNLVLRLWGCGLSCACTSLALVSFVVVVVVAM